MSTTAGKKSDVYVTAGASVPMTNEPMTDITAAGFAARTTYSVTNAVKRYFDPATALVIQQSLDSGGTWNPVTPDVIAPGYVQFVTPRQLSPLALLRVSSGSYLSYSKVAGGTEWTLNTNMTLFDSTTFGANSKTFIASALDAGTVQVKRFYQNDATLSGTLGNLVVLVLYVDATGQPAGPRYEMLARLNVDALKVATAALEEEDVTFTLTSDVAFLAV